MHLDTNIKSLMQRKKAKKGNCAKEKHVYVMGLIALYKVTPSGTMKRLDEVNIEMGRNFFASEKGNMTLTRSYGKNLISLCNFDHNDKHGNYFKVKAWTTSLKPWPVKDELN